MTEQEQIDEVVKEMYCWKCIETKRSTKEDIRKETAKEILSELDLFLKGTTLRKGYELKKINEKLKEIAEEYGVEVEE